MTLSATPMSNSGLSVTTPAAAGATRTVVAAVDVVAGGRGEGGGPEGRRQCYKHFLF